MQPQLEQSLTDVLVKLGPERVHRALPAFEYCALGRHRPNWDNCFFAEALGTSGGWESAQDAALALGISQAQFAGTIAAFDAQWTARRNTSTVWSACYMLGLPRQRSLLVPITEEFRQLAVRWLAAQAAPAAVIDAVEVGV